MEVRINSFYRQEIIISLIGVSIGIAFTLLYFSALNVDMQYTYLFYTLAGFGLIFIVRYSMRWFVLRRRKKSISTTNKSTEIVWVQAKIKSVEFNRIVLQVFLVIGLLLFLIGFAGIMKQFLGSTGLGILFASAIWFAIELFSELHHKEYLTFLEK